MLLFLFKLLLTNPLEFLIAIIVLIMPLLISITIHEWSHGMVAYLFGDPTPKQQGRLTLNPFAHLDLAGTLMLFIVGVGWAKPVEINPNNIHGKTKQMLVALAGPASNMIMAVFISFIVYGLNVYIYHAGATIITDLISKILSLIIKINIILAIFNMLPIPPLDGSNVLKWMMPQRLAEAYYSRIAPFGLIILILLLFTVGFGFIFNAANTVENYIFKIIEYILNPVLK